MKISVVTILFNQAHFLEEAILSVLNQKHADFEYIVVDPGSTDGSRDIIEKYRDRIYRIVYEKDSGAADGLNRGFAYATGEVFAFLNSDDVLLPNALATVDQYLVSNPSTGVVSGCGYFTDRDGVRIRRIVPSKLTPWLYAHGGVSVFQQGTFFRSKIYKAVGGFNVNNSTCWDGELFLDMALTGALFSTIGADLAHFRLHAGGITGSGRLEIPYRKDSERLFEKAKGRHRRPFDWIQDIVARIAKGIYDPFYYFRRLSSYFAAAR